jgi:hypothetical protein
LLKYSRKYYNRNDIQQGELGDNKLQTHLVDLATLPAHTIVILNPLLLKIDGSACPVRISQIYRDENNVLLKDVNLIWESDSAVYMTWAPTYLLGPFSNPCFLITWILQFRKEERVEIMYVQCFASSLASFFRSSQNQRTIKVDNLVVEPLCGFQACEISVTNLLPCKLGNRAMLFKSGGDLSGISQFILSERKSGAPLLDLQGSTPLVMPRSVERLLVLRQSLTG